MDSHGWRGLNPSGLTVGGGDGVSAGGGHVVERHPVNLLFVPMNPVNPVNPMQGGVALSAHSLLTSQTSQVG
jgi:hypothetical protein